MIYLLCSLFGAASLIFAGVLCTSTPYGSNASLIEAEGGTEFPLLPVSTIGGRSCDIDLTRFGCNPDSVIAMISAKQRDFHLSGDAMVARNGRLIDVYEQDAVLQNNDLILLDIDNDRRMKFRFVRKE